MAPAATITMPPRVKVPVIELVPALVLQEPEKDPEPEAYDPMTSLPDKLQPIEP